MVALWGISQEILVACHNFLVASRCQGGDFVSPAGFFYCQFYHWGGGGDTPSHNIPCSPPPVPAPLNICG